MLHLVFYAAAALVAGVGALVGASLRKDIRQRVARWLREHHLSESKLMDAVLLLDNIDSTIRAKVRVLARDRPAEVLQIERTYSESDIKDPMLLAELRKHQHAEQNVMSLFATA